MPALYLASTSPRRRQLLTAAGIEFELCEPGPENVAGECGPPSELAAARARRKATGAVAPGAGVPVLGVDTVVDLDGRELGKPRDREDAIAMLHSLSGRRHCVHTAHCLVPAGGGALREAVTTSTVQCRTPGAAELRAYLDSGEWQGKAGGYGIQDDAQSFLTLADGAFDTVVGINVDAVRRLLDAVAGT